MPLMRQCRKYGGGRRATNDVTIWRIRVACWISKATRVHVYSHAHAAGTNTHACTRALIHIHTDNI